MSLIVLNSRGQDPAEFENHTSMWDHYKIFSDSVFLFVLSTFITEVNRPTPYLNFPSRKSDLNLS